MFLAHIWRGLLNWQVNLPLHLELKLGDMAAA